MLCDKSMLAATCPLPARWRRPSFTDSAPPRACFSAGSHSRYWIYIIISFFALPRRLLLLPNARLHRSLQRFTNDSCALLCKLPKNVAVGFGIGSPHLSPRFNQIVVEFRDRTETEWQDFRKRVEELTGGMEDGQEEEYAMRDREYGEGFIADNVAEPDDLIEENQDAFNDSLDDVEERNIGGDDEVNGGM